jgi:Virulence-associated protein E
MSDQICTQPETALDEALHGSLSSQVTSLQRREALRGIVDKTPLLTIANYIASHKVRLNLMNGLVEVEGKTMEPSRWWHDIAHRDLVEIASKNHLSAQVNKFDGLGNQFIEKVLLAARANEFRPFTEWFQKLTPIEPSDSGAINEIIGLLGYKPGSNEARLFTKFLVGAVTRALEPGCKLDTVFVLVGGEGTFKSTFFQTISQIYDDFELYYDVDKSNTDKDHINACHGSFIANFDEFNLDLKADRNKIKADLTRQRDRVVQKFERFPMTLFRAYCSVGTTNDHAFLTKERALGRRIDPILIKRPIDINRVQELRHQMWQEALHLYNEKYRIFRNHEEEALHQEYIQRFMVTVPSQDNLELFIKKLSIRYTAFPVLRFIELLDQNGFKGAWQTNKQRDDAVQLALTNLGLKGELSVRKTIKGKKATYYNLPYNEEFLNCLPAELHGVATEERLQGDDLIGVRSGGPYTPVLGLYDYAESSLQRQVDTSGHQPRS